MMCYNLFIVGRPRRKVDVRRKPVSMNVSSIDPFAMIAIVLVAVMGVLFLIPTEHSKRRRRKSRKADPEHKDWKGLSLTLEKHVYALRRDVEQRIKQELILEKELTLQKEKYGKLQDKLGQERKWQTKDKSEKEKKSLEILRLTKDLKAAETHLTKEHGERLRLERELKEAGEMTVQAKDQRLATESELAKEKARCEDMRKEMSELRAVNNKLSKKHEEASFVAKSEFTQIEKKLKEAQKELEIFKQKVRREMS